MSGQLLTLDKTLHMSNIRTLAGSVGLLVSTVLFSFQATAQSSKDQKETEEQQQLKSMIESKKYTFLAQSASPQSGRTVQLNSDYTLKLMNDSLSCDLPYYGRSYMATPGDAGGGIQFSTTDFDYVSTPGKKGGWEITITPKNTQTVQKLQLSVASTAIQTSR
jgi:hypothetical protein